MSGQESEPWSQEKKEEFKASYIAEYPEAVVDTTKAEIMANASKNKEVAVAEARKLALEAVSHLSDTDRSWRPDSNRGILDEINTQTGAAKQARIEANDFAQVASETYDAVTKL